MVSLIRGLVVNLAAIVIMGVIIDIALPNGALRKYTHFIIGIIILVVILHPILQIFNQLPLLENHIQKNTFYMDMEKIKYQSSHIIQTQDREIAEAFMEKLQGQIENHVKNMKGYSNVKAHVVFGEQYGRIDYSDLREIHLEIHGEGSGFIEPVRIEVNTNNSKPANGDMVEQIPSNDIVDIKRALAGIYNIQQNRIYIRKN